MKTGAVLAVLLVAVGVVHCGDPLAVTPAGTFRGQQLTSYDGRKFSAFSGIPYARPPIGSLRFKEPQPIEALDDIYDATSEKDDCFQVNHGYNKYPFLPGQKELVGNEDCLYLNVYTPDLKPEIPYPVLVIIHGGAYIIGSGSSVLLGPELLMDRDVIVVTMNYRLGILGFLHLDDELVPGNMGMKDQSAALRWVQRNIVGFGGDPARITIMGESAGAASVHLHMHSPLSQGKFIRAISQSGTAGCSWAMQPLSVGRKTNLKIIQSMNCPVKSVSAILQCLQSKTIEEILAAVKTFTLFPLQMMFMPVIEKEGKHAFVTTKSLDEGTSVPWISGVNNGEGLIIYGEMLKQNDKDLSMFELTHQQILPYLLQYHYSPKKDVMTKRIRQHYMKDKPFSVENLGKVIDMFSDGMFIHGLVKAGRKHNGPMFQYYITHKGERRFNPFLPPETAKYGVDHAEELLYLIEFKKLGSDFKFNEEDKAFSNLMLDLWTNFTTYGNPTPKGGNKWPDSQKGKITAELTSSGIKLHENLFDAKMKFWDDLEKVKYSHDEL